MQHKLTARTDDIRLLTGARLQARDAFEANKNLASENDIANSIKHAEEVAHVLKTQVIQGEGDAASENKYSKEARSGSRGC